MARKSRGARRRNTAGSRAGLYQIQQRAPVAVDTIANAQGFPACQRISCARLPETLNTCPLVRIWVRLTTSTTSSPFTITPSFISAADATNYTAQAVVKRFTTMRIIAFRAWVGTGTSAPTVPPSIQATDGETGQIFSDNGTTGGFPACIAYCFSLHTRSSLFPVADTTILTTLIYSGGTLVCDALVDFM